MFAHNTLTCLLVVLIRTHYAYFTFASTSTSCVIGLGHVKKLVADDRWVIGCTVLEASQTSQSVASAEDDGRRTRVTASGQVLTDRRTVRVHSSYQRLRANTDKFLPQMSLCKFNHASRALREGRGREAVGEVQRREICSVVMNEKRLEFDQ